MEIVSGEQGLAPQQLFPYKSSNGLAAKDLLYTLGLSVCHHQSSHFHILSPELMQIFANGKQCFHPFMEFYVTHLKNSRLQWAILPPFLC